MGTIADMGTAWLIYQAVFELLDKESQTKVEAIRGNRFDKFKDRSDEIDTALEAEVVKITENCEKFCLIALDGLEELLNQHFPVEDAPK